jgi:hypothetical protein
MGFGVLMKIQSLLTKHNVELLWVIMSALADPRHPAFNTFWRAFREMRGNSLTDVEKGAKLVEKLRDILDEYLKKEK